MKKYTIEISEDGKTTRMAKEEKANKYTEGSFANAMLGDVFKGKLAILKSDFLTDDETSYGVLIKKDSQVYIKGNECNGTCYVEYLDFGFSIEAIRLNIA